MTCYHPMVLYRSLKGPDAAGKWPLRGPAQGNISKPVTVPCGRCIGCRLERSRQWAIRIMHETQCHEDNQFITLTYRPDALTYGAEKPTLNPRDLGLFWKRLRKAKGNGIRYYACGEYGERFGRPHYHACVFGLNIQDKKFHSTKGGNNLYSSDTIDNIWGLGDSIIGDVTFESAAYVARYIMDKHLGKDANYYDEVGLHPEFTRMSRRPGIGSFWYDKYKTDVFPQDYVVIRNGIKTKPPRFYSLKYELDNPENFATIKIQRELNAMKNEKEATISRLKTREAVKKRQIQSLQR